MIEEPFFHYTLKIKGFKRVLFADDAIEEPFLVPQGSEQFPKITILKNIFEIYRTFFDYKEPFLRLKGSMDV